MGDVCATSVVLLCATEEYVPTPIHSMCKLRNEGAKPPILGHLLPACFRELPPESWVCFISGFGMCKEGAGTQGVRLGGMLKSMAEAFSQTL